MKKLVLPLLLTFMTLPGLGTTVLDRSGHFPRLLDEGKGYIILGGELGNSSATSAGDIEYSLGKAAAMGLNTVLVPAYWDLTEPEEGLFDFSLTDKIIDTARDLDLGVVILWFGAWKNSMSCYAPQWVKHDTKRFQRARTASGKPLEIVSAFSTELLEADRRAFTHWLRHIAENDTAGIVKMVQIENEIGMLEDARDHCAQANEAYSKGVPEKLMRHLAANKTHLHPELKKRWEDRGARMEGSWRDVFGDDIYSDEYFMAWNYAGYVEKLASAGREITSIPFYLNAALNSRGRRPGEYPSAGPLAHLKDIWHAGSPTIDFLSPDIYDSGFAGWISRYALPDNPLFIPEVRRDDSNIAQAYYAIGHHKALGISPFSIESGDADYTRKLADAYGVLRQLSSLLTDISRKGLTEGALLSHEKPDTVLIDGDTRITLSHFFTLPWDPRAKDVSNWRDSGAILIKLATDEYILAGTGVVAKFEDVSEQADTAVRGEDGFAEIGGKAISSQHGWEGQRVGIAQVEEVCIDPDGNLQRIRTLNGDETHQGRHARISVDDNTILHIKTYKYK